MPCPPLPEQLRRHARPAFSNSSLPLVLGVAWGATRQPYATAEAVGQGRIASGLCSLGAATLYWISAYQDHARRSLTCLCA